MKRMEWMFSAKKSTLIQGKRDGSVSIDFEEYNEKSIKKIIECGERKKRLEKQVN